VNLNMLKNTPSWDWPEDAGTLIVDTLMDGGASKKDRLLAANLAGEYVVLNDKIAEALLNIVKSNAESAELRSRASISLGPGLEEADIEGFDASEDPPALSEHVVGDIQKALQSLYLDADVPKKVRRSVLEASVRNPQDWHEGAIRSAYASDDEEWRLTAVFCMCYIRGFEKQILESLESKNAAIKYEAIRAAGNWEIDAAFPYIAELIASTSKASDKSLLLAAIEAVASIRPGETEILESLVESDDDDVSEAAMDALAQAGQMAGWEDDDDDLDEDDDED
jgi:hypothetical protein